jgi:hypothetical protein
MTRCMPRDPPASAPVSSAKNGGEGGGGGGVQISRASLKGMGLKPQMIDKIMTGSNKKEKVLPDKKKGGNPKSKLFCRIQNCGENSMCNMSHVRKTKPAKVPLADRLGEVVAP